MSRQDYYLKMLRKHNQHCRLLALLTALSLLSGGCGPRRRDAAAGGATRDTPLDLPGVLAEPPPLSPVALGSRAVLAEPPDGTVQNGPFLLSLATETGARLYRSFADPAQEGFDPAAAWSEVPSRLLLVPPVTVWVVAEKDGTRGPPVRLSYPLAPAVLGRLAPLHLARLPRGGPAALITADFAAAAVATRYAAGDERRERTRVLDGVGDVPDELAAVDIVALTVEEDGDELVVTLATRAPPRQEPGYTYGFEIGPSHVTAATFGPGATYAHRIEAGGDGAAARFAEHVRWRLPLADLPQLAGETELVARGFAAAAGGSVGDRTEPLYLRSRFLLQRTTLDLAGGSLELDLRLAPAEADAPYAREYAALAQRLAPDLERAAAIPLTATRTIPLAVVDAEEAGYTGLNTSDRGVVTTLAGEASLIARAQLLAHELAHYQNARYSQLSSRWLQEGMSEWIAERLLYRHFPARAVHRFLEGLRFARLRAAVEGGLDDFALGEWDGGADHLGYEKSLAFLDLLAARLGEEPLRKAFVRAVSVPMDDEAFARFLTQETGEDILSLYAYWVRPGSPADEDADPRRLFADEDGDDLTLLDETLLGTDATRFDTDGDGAPDGEEAFAGRNPRLAASPPASPPIETSPLTRLRNASGASDLRYSFIPGDAAPALAYRHPLFLRSPYTLSVKAGDAEATSVSRPLYIAGQPVDVTLAPVRILPATPRTTSSVAEGIAASPAAAAATVTDFAGDIPRRVAAWDITGVAVEEGETALTVRVSTAARPAFHGEHGDYVLTLERTAWSATGPQSERKRALTVAAGTPYWYVYDESGNAAAGQVLPQITASFGEALVIVLPYDELSGWIEPGAERQLCVYSDVDLEGDLSIVDRGGCVSLADDMFTTRRTLVEGAFSQGRHELVLSWEAASLTAARADQLAELGASSLVAFERALGRPFLERSRWPVHVYVTPAGSGTSGSASTRSGAFVAVETSLVGAALDYLLVEQLARLAMADLLERESAPVAYWIQELYVQWLTASALYDIYPTNAVHDLHAGRLDDYRCFLAGNCPQLFSSDLPLAEWTNDTLASTGSVKSLLFTLVLDATVGAEAMARTLAVFDNAVPDAATLEARLKAFAPSAAIASQVGALFERFVAGAGEVSSLLVDADGDGLLVFEEGRLATSDTQKDPYLSPPP